VDLEFKAWELSVVLESEPVRSHYSLDLGLAERWAAMAGALACPSWASSWCGWRAAIAPRFCSFIPRPYRERVGWKGKQRELMRGESPVRTGASRVLPSQRVRHFRAHNPKVEIESVASLPLSSAWWLGWEGRSGNPIFAPRCGWFDPAPATKRVLGYLHS
jgi:hypothetical protein